MLYFIGILSCFGMTMATSLLSDMLCLFTVHIYACYLIATIVYQQQLKTAGSLWNLFRGTFMAVESGIYWLIVFAGKRHNVLRNRTDTWDYDVDQLLFGTILFTLVAFLFPTVLAYYALFAVVSCVSFGIFVSHHVL